MNDVPIHHKHSVTFHLRSFSSGAATWPDIIYCFYLSLYLYPFFIVNNYVFDYSKYYLLIFFSRRVDRLFDSAQLSKSVNSLLEMLPQLLSSNKSRWRLSAEPKYNDALDWSSHFHALKHSFSQVCLEAELYFLLLH